MSEGRIPPVHPGEILLVDFLKPMGISQYRLAQSIHVTAQHIGDIVHGRCVITADTALRLGRFFNMEPQFWMNLQARYNLDTRRSYQGH
jgi:addiction module HigA family antidote